MHNLGICRLPTPGLTASLPEPPGRGSKLKSSQVIKIDPTW